MQPVAVGIIMLKDGQVLICQRKRTARYPLKWEFPGGKIEPTETPLQALKRELHEELSIEMLDAKEFFRQEWTNPENPTDASKNGSFRVFYFLVDGFRGELVNNAFEQILWVAPSALRAMDILEGNTEAVEHLIKHVRQEQAT